MKQVLSERCRGLCLDLDALAPLAAKHGPTIDEELPLDGIPRARPVGLLQGQVQVRLESAPRRCWVKLSSQG